MMVSVKGNWPEYLSVMVSVKGNSFFRKFMPQLFLMLHCTGILYVALSSVCFDIHVLYIHLTAQSPEKQYYSCCCWEKLKNHSFHLICVIVVMYPSLTRLSPLYVAFLLIVSRSHRNSLCTPDSFSLTELSPRVIAVHCSIACPLQGMN